MSVFFMYNVLIMYCWFCLLFEQVGFVCNNWSLFGFYFDVRLKCNLRFVDYSYIEFLLINKYLVFIECVIFKL